MKWSGVAGGLALALAILPGCVLAGDPEIGRRIYLDGILPDGQPLQATLPQGIRLSGAQAACVTCHRRSGLGGSEGGTLIRPIAGPYLYSPITSHPRMYAGTSSAPGMRPAYTDASLARVLREGVDAAGHALAGPMPRYALADAAMGDLIAYLKTLSATSSPGVSETEIHFATIVDAAADPAERDSMLTVMEAFIHDKNAGTRLETHRAQRADWKMARRYKAYRTWKMHVWTLEGPPETWEKQLEEHYRNQPVFAVLSGIGQGTWRPVHDFCERTKLPCLLPQVDLPPATPGDYAIYFSRGLELEAAALAQRMDATDKGTILQVYRSGSPGERAAAVLRERLHDASRLSDHALEPQSPADARFWSALLERRQPATLLLWLEPDDLAGLAALPPDQAPARLYLSGTLAEDPSLPAGLLQRTYLAYPYELPHRLEPRLRRLNVWLHGRGLEQDHQRIQANTTFALAQAGEALMHMVDNFQRDYFIERVEHAVENSLAPSTYPRPSLGPGQRFVSKGCHIVHATALMDGRDDPEGAWIVPEWSSAR